MGIISNLSPNFIQIFQISWLFITKGGWILFVMGMIYMLYLLYREETEDQFIEGIEWVFLNIHVPKENRVSTLAVENIFAQMHVLHRSLTFQEVYIEGQFQQWYSLELISLGGKISFIVRAPKRYRHLVESAFYSQYPNAEIFEVADYMENLENLAHKPDNAYEFFGTEFKLTYDSVVPIKTYKDFEHPAAEEQVIDPLSNLFETLERIEPHEFFGIQILIQPIQNDEWRERAESKIKELTGEEVPHKLSFLNLLLFPFEWFAKFSYKETLLGGGHGHDEKENKPRNNWLSMTEAEKERVGLIERKVAKATYNSKIRLLYMAPKEKYDKIKRFELIGAFRHFSSGLYNTLKSDKNIWTKVDPLFSAGLEKPFLEHENKRRKYWFLKGYKGRSVYIGSPKFLLNTEELATLYHFPITPEGGLIPAGVQAVESKKVRAPANLPVLENY